MIHDPDSVPAETMRLSELRNKHSYTPTFDVPLVVVIGNMKYGIQDIDYSTGEVFLTKARIPNGHAPAK